MINDREYLKLLRNLSEGLNEILVFLTDIRAHWSSLGRPCPFELGDVNAAIVLISKALAFEAGTIDRQVHDRLVRAEYQYLNNEARGGGEQE